MQRRKPMEMNRTLEDRTCEVRLTQREKKIVDFIRENGDSFLNDTITDFSEKVGVSDATIVRFCKHLGYKGYQDFKLHAARELLPKEQQFNPKLNQEDDSAGICGKVFNSEMSVLNRTLQEIDLEVLEQIAEEIRRADRVILFGTGGSLNVAKDAQHKFMKIGIMVYVFDDMDIQHMAASLMKEGDVAIIISHSGSNVSSLECLEMAKEGGACTVALTGIGKSPIAKEADLTVHIAAEKTIFQSESVSTRIAQLAVLDTLVAMTAMQDYESSYTAAMTTRKATSQTKM